MPHTQRAFDGLSADLDMIRERTSPRSFLYVGWRHDCKPWWYDVMCTRLGVNRVEVLEIFPKNVADLEMQVWSGRYPNISNVAKGDVRSAAVDHDVIFWDHGPEHVSYDDLVLATKGLQVQVGKVLIYCCPWGEWPQDATDNNEHEIHRTTVTKEMLEGLGFQIVRTFGQPGQSGEGELLAYYFR